MYGTHVPVWGSELEVDSRVEDDEGGEWDDARDEELVPPGAECDVVLVLVERCRPVVRPVGAVRLKVELEKLRDV